DPALSFGTFRTSVAGGPGKSGIGTAPQLFDAGVHVSYVLVTVSVWAMAPIAPVQATAAASTARALNVHMATSLRRDTAGAPGPTPEHGTSEVRESRAHAAATARERRRRSRAGVNIA